MTKTLYVVEGTNGKADRLRPVSTGPDKPFVAPTPTPDPVGFLPYWGMPAWSDEFDTVDPRTLSGVNPDKWTVREDSQNNHIGFNTARPENVRVNATAKQLEIVAIRESGVTGVTGAVQPSSKTFTTAYLDSHDSAQYGRWDIMAKLNTHTLASLGMWPALWLRPVNPPAGTDGEIDIMEAYGGPWAGTSATNGDRYRLGSASSTLHQNEQLTHLKSSGWLTVGDNNPDLGAANHLYSLEWTPTAMTIFVDGVAMKTTTYAAATWMAQSFNAKFYFKIQLQVGNSYWGFPDPNQPQLTKSPSDPFCISYIRRYAYPG
jgi:beta-glucanase (GH16 family)